jgi:hypothetical protein
LRDGDTDQFDIGGRVRMSGSEIAQMPGARALRFLSRRVYIVAFTFADLRH